MQEYPTGTLHAWKGYREFAWGKDEFLPISKQGSDWFAQSSNARFGLGLTIIDSLDLFDMMRHENEDCARGWTEARDWIVDSLDVHSGEVNLFETTIRVLGGLLSGFHSSKDKRILKKAVELGDGLMFAFQTDSGIPMARCIFFDSYLS